MVSDDRIFVWLLAVLVTLCPMGLYWSIGAVLVGVVLIGYIHWVEFQHTLSECLVLLHVVGSEENFHHVGTKGVPLCDVYHRNVL